MTQQGPPSIDKLLKEARTIRRRAAHLGEPRAPLEADEQRTLAQFLDLVLPPNSWCHVPNGGERDRRVAAKLAGHGVKRGVPDVLIFRQPRKWSPWKVLEISGGGPSYPIMVCQPQYIGDNSPRGVAIELKRRDATPSAISPEQQAWGEKLAENGWYWFVARGAGEAIDELKRIGLDR